MVGVSILRSPAKISSLLAAMPAPSPGWRAHGRGPGAPRPGPPPRSLGRSIGGPSPRIVPAAQAVWAAKVAAGTPEADIGVPDVKVRVGPATDSRCARAAVRGAAAAVAETREAIALE